jgi:hypothetical protein
VSDVCKSCGAAIQWVKTPVGKAMPLSVASKAKRIVIDDEGIAQVVDTYVSHFADCPNAAQHRKIYPDRGGRL